VRQPPQEAIQTYGLSPGPVVEADLPQLFGLAKVAFASMPNWSHDEKFETLMPNEPKITSGKIIAQSNELAVA